MEIQALEKDKKLPDLYTITLRNNNFDLKKVEKID